MPSDGTDKTRKHRRIPSLYLAMSLLAVSALSACTPMKTIDARNAQAVADSFAKGQLSLSNGPGGIGNYVENRSSMHALYAANEWKTLALKVVQVDYGIDLDWFYLGAAAEGLGFTDAARTYYLKASTTILHCGGHAIGTNDCSGIDIAKEVAMRIDRLSPAMADRTLRSNLSGTASVPSHGISEEDAAAIMAQRRAMAIASASGAAASPPPKPAGNPTTASTRTSIPPGTPSAGMTAAPDIRIAGVKLGMTHSEATAALRRFNPRLQVVERYTAYGNGLLYTAGRTNFSPANIAFFSTLVAVEHADLAGASNARSIDTADAVAYGPSCSSTTRGPREKIGYRVLFSIDLVDPRVVLVEEKHAYCAHDVTVESAIKTLYDRFSHAIARRLRIRDDGLRVTPDTYPSVNDGAAFLEWRFGAPSNGAALPNQIEVPMVNAWGAYWMIGNPGGGIAVHAEIRPANDLVYMGSVQTILWNDDAMANFYQRQSAMISELDRLNIGIGQLGDRARIAEVRIP